MASAPIAVYTDIDDTDVSLGVEMLERAGFTVRILGTRDAAAIVEGARDADVLLNGYAQITRSWRCRGCGSWPPCRWAST